MGSGYIEVIAQRSLESRQTCNRHMGGGDLVNVLNNNMPLVAEVEQYEIIENGPSFPMLFGCMCWLIF